MNDDQSLDMQRIIMNVRQTGGFMLGFTVLQVELTIKLIQFLMRLQKKHVLRGGEVKRVKTFLKACDGKYNIMNVPITKSTNKESLKKELDAAGICYTMMPDLNKKDNVFQIMVYEEDQPKFNAIYARSLMKEMQGGRKKLDDLLAVTEGRTNIVSLPLEGKKTMVCQDFNKLRINYASLPDLNVGDGEIQFVVADVDLAKVKSWFELYREDQLKNGVEVPEMHILNQDSYVETSKMTEEEYMNTGDEIVQNIQKEFEGKEKGNLENDLERGPGIRSKDDAAYDIAKNNPDLLEVSINKESLVKKSQYSEIVMKNSTKFFASRVPGTYGANEQTMIIPADHVFTTDGGKTFVAFIPKDQKLLMLDPTGKMMPEEKRITGAMLKASYDKVTRDFASKRKEQLKKTPDSIQEKIPSVPVKVR